MTRAMVIFMSGQQRMMWRVALLSLVALGLFGSTVAAAGAIQDDGALFSQAARNDFTTREAQIERDTGKQIVVRTVTSLNGKDISAQADAAFAQLNVNGVLLYASKADKSLSIKTGQTTRQAISTQEEGQIRDQMLASFRTNDFDGGLLNATDRVGRDLRAVFTGTNTNRSGANQPATTSTTPAAPRATGGGIGIGAIIVVLLLIVAIVFVARKIFGRNNNNNTGVSGAPYGGNVGTNYAPPPEQGYGNNYGGGGYGQPPQRGGGFGSSVAGGAVGGFGGAILGNAVYDHFRDANGNDRNGNPVNTGGNAGNNGPHQDPNNDAGRVDDSYQDTGSWGNGGDNSAAAGGSSDPGTGSWGGDSGGDSGGGGGGDSGGSWA